MSQIHPAEQPVDGQTPDCQPDPAQFVPEGGNAVVKYEYREKACFFIKREWLVRRLCTLLIRNVWFERISLSIIAMNCVTLALYNPKDSDCETTKCQVLEKIEMGFTIFFAIEMVIKMVAMGVWGEGSYLDDSWNRLDFFIVIMGLIDLLPFDSLSGVTALRALRALRPLRTINKLPGLRILITLLLETLPMMGNVCLLACFLMLVFAIIGMQLWSGVYRQRCRDPATGLDYDPDGFGLANSFTCSTAEQDGWLSCAPTDEYTNALVNYSSYTSCDTGGSNPAAGAVSFDNVFSALVLVFQVVALEQWIDLLYPIMDGFSPACIIYFAVVIFMGNYCVMNLFLVIITRQFGSTKTQISVEKAAEKADEEKLAQIAGVLNALGSKQTSKVEPEGAAEAGGTGNSVNGENVSHSVLEGVTGGGGVERGTESGETTSVQEKSLSMLDRASVGSIGSEGTSDAESDQEVEEIPAAALCRALCPGGGCSWCSVEISRFVLCDPFNNFIMFAILLNTVIMATEHFEQSETMDSIQDIANYIFTAIFAIEMILKLTTLGIEGYWCNRMNAFDGVIVISSLIELPLSGSGSMSILRAFRVLRVFKLVKFMPGIQRQLEVLVSSVSGMGSFLIILALFVFIYAIFGMYIFGDKFDHNNDGKITGHERKNFDTLLWALVTVFQVLTIEDWPATLTNGVEAIGWPAVLYFVSLLIMGHFILISLFVAILLEGFAIQQANDDRIMMEEMEALKKQNVKAFRKIKNMINSRTKGFKNICFFHWRSIVIPEWKPKAKVIKSWGKAKINLGKLSAMGKKSKSSLESLEMTPSVPEPQKEQKPRRKSLVKAQESGKKKTKSPVKAISSDPLPPVKVSKPVAGEAKPTGGDSCRGIAARPSSGVYRENPDSPIAEESPMAMADNKLNPHLGSTNTSLSTTHTSELGSSDGTIGLSSVDSLPSLSFAERTGPVSSSKDGSATGAGGTVGADDADDSIPDGIRPPVSKYGSPTPIVLTPVPSSVGSPPTPIVLTPRLLNDVLDDTNNDVLHETNTEGFDDTNTEGLDDTINEVLDDANNEVKKEDCDTKEAAVGIAAKEDPKEDTVDCEECEDEEDEEEEMYCCGLMEQSIHARDLAFCCFHRDDQPRAFLWDIVAGTHKETFDRCVLVSIVISGIFLAIERPSVSATERTVLDVANLVFSILFTIEMGMKVLAMGFLFGPTAYIKNSWNRLDGCLVLISWLTLAFDYADVEGGSALDMLRVLRILRTLRPLRAIQRFPSLRLVVRSLAAATGPISQTMAIASVFFIIFAILGVQLMNGQFYYCAKNDGGWEWIQDVSTKAECQSLEALYPTLYRWQNRNLNFDNTWNALITLFFVANTDGWVEILYNGIDVNGEYMNPKQDASEGMLIFFISFFILANFFLLNLFIGVVADNYQRMMVLFHQLGSKATSAPDEDPAELLADYDSEDEAARVKQLEIDEQIEAQEVHEAKVREEVPLAEEIPDITESPLRLKGLAILQSLAFEYVIAGLIVSNMILFMTEHFNMSDDYQNFLDITNIFYTVVFTFEFLLKYYVLRCSIYMRSYWNRFDLFIVVVSIISLVMDYALKNSSVNPTVLRVIRVFRIARMLRLFKAARGMQSLIATVLKSIPQVMNMAALLFLIFFIFACAAVEIFGKIGCSEMYPCVGIDMTHSNFENFGMAFITLFRIMTGDNGNGILQDALREPPYCNDSSTCETHCCANVYVAPVFFVLFTVITQFVLLNVVVAVLLTALEEAAAQDRKEAEEEVAAERALAYQADGNDETNMTPGAEDDASGIGIKEDCLQGCRSATGGLHYKGHHPRCPNFLVASRSRNLSRNSSTLSLSSIPTSSPILAPQPPPSPPPSPGSPKTSDPLITTTGQETYQ